MGGRRIWEEVETEALIKHLQVSFLQKTRWKIICLSGGAGLKLYAKIRTAYLSQETCHRGQLGKRGSRVLRDLLQNCLQLLVGDGAGRLNRSQLKACPSQKGCFADKRTGEGFCQHLAVAAKCRLAGTSCSAECWLVPGTTSTGMPGEVSVLFLPPRELKGFVATRDRFKVYLNKWGYKPALTHFP